MLTETEQREIEAAVRHEHDARAACPEALKIVQKYRGWVSDESVQDVAAALAMTADEVDAIATCYNLIFRRQVGRHVILMCDSVTCYVMGYEGLREHLHKRLGIGFGQTSADGRFTLLPVACLGACDAAPAVMIDETLHGKLTTQLLDAVLEQYS